MDLDTGRGVAEAVRDADAVCHLGALVRLRDSVDAPLRYWRTNVGGTLAVLDGLVAASTCTVYGDPPCHPVTDDVPAVPSSPYGSSKLAADLAVRDAARAGTIGAISLRATNVAGGWAGVGDRDESRLIPRTLAVAAGAAPELVVNGDGSAVRDFVHVRDMAGAFVHALDACEPGRWRAYNIGGGLRSSVDDVVRTVASVTGGKVAVRRGPAAAEPRVLVADHSRATRELGWRPVRSDLPTVVADAWRARTGL